MMAPQRFANWMNGNTIYNEKTDRTYCYHSRSDSHSVRLCEFILQDLVDGSELIREHLAEGKIAFGINLLCRWERTDKQKNIDLALVVPSRDSLIVQENGLPKHVLPSHKRGERIVNFSYKSSLLVSTIPPSPVVIILTG